MPLNIKSLEESVLLLEWRYFITIFAICMLIYAISILIYGSTRIPLLLTLMFGSLLLSHIFMMAWWHWRLRLDRQRNCYMGDNYIPPKPFLRGGYGSTFKTLKFSVLAQGVLIYILFSAGVAELIAISYGQLAN